MFLLYNQYISCMFINKNQRKDFSNIILKIQEYIYETWCVDYDNGCVNSNSINFFSFF